MKPSRNWNDHRLEQIIGNLLRTGVMAAAAILLLGGALYLLRYGHGTPNYRTFQGEPSELRNVVQIVKETATFHSRAIIQFGLLLLIATPVARVLFALIGFFLEGDYVYVAVSCIVLTVLLYSVLGHGM